MDARFAPSINGTDVVACCPDWSTDDFILWGIYEFLEGGEYAMISCPHCEIVQYVDIPVDAWSIEAERQKRFASERQAVNEAIEAEKLTVEEMVARMPDGWTLVSSESWSTVVQQRNDYIASCKKLRGRMSNMRLTLITAAMMIGGQGGATHRDKDEVSLQAIAKILRCAYECDDEPENSYTDDIPF